MKDNFYELLGINQDATIEEIQEAYNTKIQDLYVDRDNGVLADDEADKQVEDLQRAFEVLSDDETRQAYNQWIDEQETVKFVDNTETDDEENKKGNGKKVGLRILAGCVAAAVVVSTLGIYFAKRGKDPKDYTSNNSSDYSTSDSNTPSSSTSSTSTSSTPTEESKTPVEEITSNLPKVEDHGDINDTKLVNERTTSLLNQLNSAGLYNMATNAPYTEEEIKDIILYVNGAYVPENEVDALSKVNDFLNLAIAPLNSEAFIYAVGYQSGEDNLKGKVEENAKKIVKVDYVKTLLFGDSIVAPYLEWIQEQYYKMLTTTDRKKCASIYDSIMQSLADYSFGNGFELNGKVYKESMGTGLDKVNSGNILQFLVYIMEPFRTKMTKDTFTVTDKFISSKPDENKVNISYKQIAEWYSPLCSIDSYKYDDKGYILTEDYSNFATVNQINTTNALLENLYRKNKNISNKKLTK